MRKPKLRELWEAIKVLLVYGPYTSKFPREMTVPPETFRGKPEFNPDRCIGCGACSEVCPSRSIEIIDNKETKTRTLKLRYDICNFCGQCHLNCTTKDGIDYTTEYDLAALDRSDMEVTIERKLVLCEICGGVVGTTDHLEWIAKRIGTLAYANPTLVLAGFDEPAVLEPVIQHDRKTTINREDIFRILCPECRRRVYLSEEWS